MNTPQNLFKFIVVNLIAVSFLGACASKPAARPDAPVAGPALPAPETKPDTPAVKPVEKIRISLTLGGAGVASFATVGLLKRLQEEGIVIDSIVSTGWPTLFALGYGFLGSVHDLEWFAMRLQEKDFYKAGLFDEKDYAAHDKLTGLIEGAFKQRDLGECRIPVVIAATNTELGHSEIIERGDWKKALLKTMSVPGIYRPYPEGDTGWVQSLQGMDVEEAVRRGSKTVVAVEMYGDYFKHFVGGKQDSERVFRQLYLTQIRKSLSKEMKLAQLTGEISLGRPANDFAAKRAAILAGYKEGARLAKALRNMRPAVN